jgi:hypothetical protein
MAGDDEILRIAAQFDVGAITAGMDTAASAVQAGAARMAASLQKSGLSAEETASALKNLGYSAEEVKAAVGNAAAEFDQMTAASDRAARSVNNSRIAFTGLTQDLGVRGSRALGSFIAQSATLGPILQAAFPIVAAVAFFEILEAGYQKIIDVTAAMAGWTKEAKAQYEQLVKLNREQVSFNEQLDIEKLELSLAGLKGEALDRAKINELLQKRILLGKDLAVSDANIARLRKEQEGTVEHVQSTPTPYGPSVDVDIKKTPDAGRLKEINDSLQAAIAKSAELNNQILRLGQVELPKEIATDKAKQLDDAAKAAEKYAEALAKMYDEESALSQRNAEKELRDMERVASEKERLDEELAKETQEMAKKDLEEFERTLIEKTRLQEQAGKGQLEQIRLQAEMQQKAVLSRSIFGEEDPRLIQIADQALDQQAFKLMDLIALEEQLREKLIQTGIAETDPRVLESWERQQQLVQQLNLAVQKYDQQIQKFNEETTKKMVQDFDQALKSITGSLNQNVTLWITGQEKFGQAAGKVWTSLVDSALQALLKMAEQMIEEAIMPLVAAIPIVGPFLAAGIGIGGAAAGGGSSGGGGGGGGDDLGDVLGFAGGGITGATGGLALLHPREMVLPSHISERVQQMASSAPSSGGRGGGAPLHVHFHGEQSKSDMAKQQSDLVAMVRLARRRGSF